MTPEHRERRALSVPLIVEAAIALADEQGLDAVSTRRLGGRLGTSGMAVYRHVSGRGELLELMVDEVAGRFPYPEPRPSSWREALEAAAWQDWRSYRAHPWLVAAAAGTRPHLGSNSRAAMEWTLAALDGFGLGSAERLHLLGTVASYGRGLALAWMPEGGAPPPEPPDIARHWRERFDPGGDSAADHPRLAAAVAELTGDRGAPGPDAEFGFGLARVLDGIARHLRTA
ncbi:TetR/AcrR family transcriptional regulator C-terminal domain-containing protein [Nocardiopsis sp. CNT-189]|uniref:TetR/AcrR family transcriptional regulator n=1 Tax=Nocardiopsis oceanisediminis TaxID=2816862 RepID=UPI003B36E900